MSDEDVKKLGENPGKPDLDRHKKRIADRTAQLARAEEREKDVDAVSRSTDYQNRKGAVEMLKDSETAVLSAKTQVELVYQLGETNEHANARLEKFKASVKDDPVYTALQNDKVFLNADRSNGKQVQAARQRVKDGTANGQAQEMLAKIEQLEGAVDYSKSIFVHEKGKLVEHAASLGIADPKKTVDEALKMQGLAEEAKKAKGPGMSIPYAADKEPSKGAGR